MIIVEDVEQGTDEWFDLKIGIPTASQFDQIITPSGKPSAMQDKLLDSLISERVEGEYDRTFFKSYWVDRGNELEEPARERFAFDHDTPVREVGLVYRDEKKLISCSPDGLHHDDREGLEIKNPKGSTMVGYIREGVLPDCYKPQVYGSLWVTGCEAWWFMANHPKFKPLYIKVEPDGAYYKTISVLLENFIDKLSIRMEQIKPYIEDLS